MQPSLRITCDGCVRPSRLWILVLFCIQTQCVLLLNKDNYPISGKCALATFLNNTTNKILYLCKILLHNEENCRGATSSPEHKKPQQIRLKVKTILTLIFGC